MVKTLENIESFIKELDIDNAYVTWDFIVLGTSEDENYEIQFDKNEKSGEYEFNGKVLHGVNISESDDDVYFEYDDIELHDWRYNVLKHIAESIFHKDSGLT